MKIFLLLMVLFTTDAAYSVETDEGGGGHQLGCQCNDGSTSSVEDCGKCICNADPYGENGYTKGCYDPCKCCQNTCKSSGTTSCTIANGIGAKANTGGNSCRGEDCTYGACSPTSCNNKYYKNVNLCSSCPTGPADSTVASKNNGMNGISDCYITGQFQDSSGRFEISGNDCVYKEDGTIMKPGS